MKPYKGEFSVYSATASLTSASPPLPRFNSSTSSLVVYLRRNLRHDPYQHSVTGRVESCLTILQILPMLLGMLH